MSQVKDIASRDQAIINSFKQMSLVEIERLFRTAGGLYATQCYPHRNASSIVAERDDKWILEIRPGANGSNNAWIKATTKTISDKEREWVLSWLETLGFDPAEAIIYFNSNIPRKRDIAVRVGKVLKEQKLTKCPLKPDSPETRAAIQVNGHIDALVHALQSSGRISHHSKEQALEAL